MRLAAALLLALVAGRAGADEPGPPRIAGVELRLPTGADPTGLPALVGVRKGQALSRRAVRRSIERLFATQRFADVVVREEPLDGGVNVVFDLTPKRAIAKLDVGGNAVLTDAQVLAAAKLTPGSEYYPERIDAALAAITEAYRLRGYERATVAADLTDTPAGTEVLFFTEENAPTRVRGVAVSGNPGLPLPRILAQLQLQVGEVLNRAEIDKGLDRLRALYRSERFFRARVGEPVIVSEGGHAEVSLPVSAGPQFTLVNGDRSFAETFFFHGNRSLPDGLLRGVLDYDGSEPLDGGVLARLARRVEAFYRFRGFPDAHVEVAERSSAGGTHAIVVFDVEEGRSLFVREVRFEGSRAIPSTELSFLLEDVFHSLEVSPRGESSLHDDPVDLDGKRPSRLAVASPEPLAVYVDQVYARVPEVAVALYRERGFLSAKVTRGPLQVDERTRTATATFVVEEGPRAMLSGVFTSGAPQGFDARAPLGLKTGEPFRSAQVESARGSLTRALGRAGYLFAQVRAENRLSADGSAAEVTFAIEAGPRVTVGQVIVQGLNRTEEDLVRANLKVRPGDVLDPEKLFESQKDLVLLGIFRQVGVKLLDPDAPEPVKDVVVELRERSRLESEVAVGFNLADGPRVLGDVSYPNLFGRGLNFAARGKINYVYLSNLPTNETRESYQGLDGVGGRLNLSLAQPRFYPFYPAQVGFRADLIGERVFRQVYRFSRFAAVAGLDWEALSWMNLSLQAELEQDSVKLNIRDNLLTLGRVDQERLRFPEGVFTLVTARPQLTLDFRDDPINPRSGLLLSASAELTRDLYANQIGVGDVDIFTLKVAGLLSVYVPLADRVVLALSGRAGRVYPLLEGSITIPPKRFFLGGTSSMRGFREDGVIPEDDRAALHEQNDTCRTLISATGCTPDARVLLGGGEVLSQGGQLFTLGKAELRLPGPGAFDFGLFFEAGNLWSEPSNYQPFVLRTVAGVGVRYGTPIGPLALDVGFNLNPDEQLNERVFSNVNFSIGVF